MTKPMLHASEQSKPGRVALVTGTRGIGLEVASALHLAGFTTYVVGRDRGSGAAAVQRLTSERSDVACDFLQADLGDLASVQALAAGFRSRSASLDVLVNNAAVVSSKRISTASGWDAQIGVNYLGHFALTGLLLPELRRSTSARVVNVVSRGVSGGRVDHIDLQPEGPFNPMSAYSTSKRALLWFGYHLDALSRTEGWNLSSYVAHPGICPTGIMDGAIESRLLRRVVRSLHGLIGHAPAEAARAIVRCALDDALEPGSVIGPSGYLEARGEPAVSSLTRLAPSAAAAAMLWDRSQQMTGRPFPERLNDGATGTRASAISWKPSDTFGSISALGSDTTKITMADTDSFKRTQSGKALSEAAAKKSGGDRLKL